MLLRAMLLLPLVLGFAARLAADDGQLKLKLRSRIETAPGSGYFHTITREQTWEPRATAVIVCDMWDVHHCLNAVRRATEMAPRMNELLGRLRDSGATLIHAPSGCMEFYANHPARRRAVETPRAAQLPEDIGQWCYQIPAEEAAEYPIDQSDGGEDDDPEEHREWAKKLARMGRNPREPWVRQTELLTIADTDYISDSGEEIWSILAAKNIDQVMLVGVHTNMCVLGRPFGLRNMARYGKNVVLVRDLTDTMYNPARPPFVSHFTATDLIVEHIEKWICPTITSNQILGGWPFRFAADKRPHVALIIAEPEYKTAETLSLFARLQLGMRFQTSLVFGAEDESGRLPGLEVLDEADVALISVRRRALPADQMAILRRFVMSGKPVVGIRTASHAFSLRGAEPPPGRETWESWDRDVFGGNYSNHHGAGPQTRVRVAARAERHPLLSGVDVSQLIGYGSLYMVRPLADSATELLIGEIPEHPAEPIAWTHTTRWGGKAFYTSLGHPNDFSSAFHRLLTNALEWAVAE